jgi:prepilin-type N-terminal cleavage/methylation domain-containing protein
MDEARNRGESVVRMVVQDREADGDARRSPGRGGFTLIELLIVLAVTGLMLSMGMTQLGQSSDRHRARRAADELVSVRELARTTAIRLGRTVELRHDWSAGRFWVEVGTDTVVTPRGFSMPGVVLKGRSDPVCFDARGIPTEAGGCDPVTDTLTVTRGSTQVRVAILEGGGVEIR